LAELESRIRKQKKEFQEIIATRAASLRAAAAAAVADSEDRLQRSANHDAYLLKLMTDNKAFVRMRAEDLAVYHHTRRTEREAYLSASLAARDAYCLERDALLRKYSSLSRCLL